MLERPILKLEMQDGKYCLRIATIDSESLPSQLNGENGLHIFHVSLLTSMILSEYCRNHPEAGLSEEDVYAIGIASALHDIGKLQIPKSILDFPGKLSPVEYDIVKKHSVLGESIIGQADASGIDPKIISHAKEIARHHHERYDGTGYPDGLRGAEIPLSAQAVSLADAYDALTSQRSYKKAFSQDVAIQMISSGMCGVFDEKLIDSLLKVINTSDLLDLRKKLEQTGAVVENEGAFTPSRVLLIGNTAYVTRQFLEIAFPESKVLIVGPSDLRSHGNLKVMNYQKPSLPSIFRTYEFDAIVYFSSELTYESQSEEDLVCLREVLKQVKKTQSDVKILYLSSLDCAFVQKNDHSILCGTKEELCLYYNNDQKLDIRIVRIPYLYSHKVDDGLLHKIFTALQKNGKVDIEQQETDAMYFLSMEDLASLIGRLIENWAQGGGILTVGDEFELTFADLGQAIASLGSEIQIFYSEQSEIREMKPNNKALRNQYGWFSKISILEDLPFEYEQFLVAAREKQTTKWQRFKAWLNRHAMLIKTIELILLFLLTEGLIQLTGNGVLISVVDFRMAFVVIMATVHGIGFGLIASALSSFSWLFAKIMAGTSWLTIFYEPTNWLPFIFYFLIGAVCGYVRLKNEDILRSSKEEKQIMEEKLLFTRDIYNDTYREKNDLKKQIISSKDSFGKIFDITRRLDTVETHTLYLKIIESFEDILENKSIAVYSIQNENRFGRLEVSSRDIVSNVARSISTETYAPVIQAFANGEIWKNTELLPDLPMYAAGVYRQEKLVLMIFLWHADMDQYSLYYVNLFKILRDLAQMSLLRAYDYNQAIYEKQFIENTRIMNAEAFETCLGSFAHLLEKKVFSYVLLDVDCEGLSIEEVNATLSPRVRVNDIIGDAGNGHFRILLSQATEKDLQYVLPRFESLGREVTVLHK